MLKPKINELSFWEQSRSEKEQNEAMGLSAKLFGKVALGEFTQPALERPNLTLVTKTAPALGEVTVRPKKAA